ncbi:alpha/beta fold hydrolase [Streptomyces hygroscopicus]|uniref:alpha/beta fold hydrolase n=1 Tax=Streptomyces hygroscopicus TaxID=1912 RepID=UPI0036B96E75
MPHARANGITIEYESHGPEGGDTILLIMGMGGQLTQWPLGLIELLAAKGFRVIRYDARDVGLSEKMDAAGLPDMEAVATAVAQGDPAPVAYHLDDMAADAVGLLDALNVRKAHIVGASMGGMVAQLVAADHPDHVLSLTSIMSTTANPDLPAASQELTEQFTRTPPDAHEDPEGFVDHMLSHWRLTRSPAYSVDEGFVRAQFAADAERSYYPDGSARHYAAIVAAPDRRPKLRTITAPTLVLHGEHDPLIPPVCGRDTANTIPGAEFRLIPGMGHDLPPQLSGLLADAIEEVARRARS